MEEKEERPCLSGVDGRLRRSGRSIMYVGRGPWWPVVVVVVVVVVEAEEVEGVW
jgi:hypothetical protein